MPLTQSEALALADDLEDLKKLRTNRFFLAHLVPQIEMLRDEHRVGMRDATLPDAQRVHHVTAWETLQSLLDFPDQSEKQIRAALKEFDQSHETVTRPWSHDPN